MYYIDFKKLKIHSVDLQNFSQCTINLCGDPDIAATVPYKTREAAINRKMVEVLDSYRRRPSASQQMAAKKGKRTPLLPPDAPVAITVWVPPTAEAGESHDDDDNNNNNNNLFEFRVSSILAAFARWNLSVPNETDRGDGREKHLDCPREFVPYLFLARNYSKRFTNKRLKIDAFTINIKERGVTAECRGYELLDSQRLAKEGVTTINAR